MRVFLALALILGLAGCTTAQTPAQSVYALEATYAAAAQAELGYISTPRANPKVVAAIKQADNIAYNALVQAEAAVRTGNDAALAAAAVVAAQSAILQLNQVLLTNGVK